MKTLVESFLRLKKYCEKEDYQGWDPYDGLNSKIFKKTPLIKNSALCRLIFIQGFKRSQINFRNLALVPKEYNAKGIGLFLNGYCNLWHCIKLKPELCNVFGEKKDIEEKINYLADFLIELRSKGNYAGSCWGYNFDWQARRLFLFPAWTPTVVATNFCATSLMEAYEITKNKDYLECALSSAQFILKDLHWTPYKDGFLFSYSPLSGNDTVFNGSLLGSRTLAYCYHYTQNKEYLTMARQSIKACCEGQQANGAWVYGMLPVQNWVDSFHTGYNLDALVDYGRLTGDNTFSTYLDKGMEYYIHHFFEDDGRPKYYNNKVYPIDIHCPGQLLVTLSKTGQYKNNIQLAHKVIDWTIKNMQDSKGYFYYQLKPYVSSKIS